MNIILKDKLPKDTDLSPDIIERSIAFIVIQLHGLKYYVPLTLEFKRLFKVSKKGDRFIFPSYKAEKRTEDFLRDFIQIMYLQVREEVGSGIHTQLSQELKQGFDNLFSNYIGNRIDHEFDQKQIGFNKGD